MEEGLTKDILRPLGDIQGKIVLGSDKFIGNIKKMLTGKSLSSDITERKRLVSRPAPEFIIKEVAAAFNADEDKIREKGQRKNMARNAAIYFVQRYAGLTNEEIGEIFGGIHYSAVSKAAERFTQEMADNNQILKLSGVISSRFKA